MTPPPEWHLTETYKSIVSLAVEALKLLALINGGAAIAVMTYLGTLAGHTPRAELPHIRPALIWYAVGLAATAFAFIVAYSTQLRLYQEVRDGRRELHWVGPVIGIFCAGVAAVAFVIGSCVAAVALVP